MAISAQGRGMRSDSQTDAEAAQSGPAITRRDAGDGVSNRGRIITSGPRERVTPLARALRRAGFSATTTSGAAELLRRLAGARPPFDAVCLAVAEEASAEDECAPLAEVLVRIGELQPGLAVVAVGEAQGAIRQAMAAGASFVLRAGATGVELCALVAGAVELTRLRRTRASEAPEAESGAPDTTSPTGNPRRPPRLDFRSIERAASMINSTADLEQVLPQICRAAVELFEVDHSGLVTFDETGDSGVVQAEYPHQGAVGVRITVRGVPAEERLFYERQPIVIDDVERAALEDLGPVAEIFARFRIRSILIVPIVSEGRVLGSFSLDAITRPRPFSDEDVELSRIFAAQIATALDKARLVLKAHQQADQLETLRHITFAMIAQRNDPRRLLGTIVARAVELLRGRGGGIYVHNEPHGYLELAAAHGYAPGLLGDRLQVNEGMAGVIVAQQLPLLIVQDYANWPGRACTYAENCLFEAVIAVPLSRERRILGVLFVDAERWRIFTAHDASLLRFFADHAAIALDNDALLQHIGHTRSCLEQLISALREIAALDTPRHDDQLRQIVQRATARLTRHDPLHPDRDGPNTILNAPGPAATTDTKPPADGPLVHAPGPTSTPVIDGDEAPGFQGSPGNSADTASLTTKILRLFADLAGRRGARGNGEAAWRALFAVLPGALLWCDPEGRIVVATEAAAGLLGHAPGELAGQSLARFFAEEQVATRLAHLLATASSEPIAEEIVVRASSGAILPLRVSLTLLTNPEGERYGALARLDDAVAPRAAEERLSLLVRASQALTGADGPLEALRNLADLLVTSLGLASCRVFLLDQQGQLVAQAVRAAAGLPWHASAGEVFRPDDWPDLAAALVVDDPTVITSEGKSAWLHAWLAPGVAPEQARALALAPLRDRHELVGLLEVGRLGATALGDFNETERQVLGEIARHVAPLIDRLRLQERAEYHRMRLVALEHASRVLRVDSDPGQLQAEVLRLAVDILQQTQAVLYTVRPQLGELEIVAVHGLPATLVGRFQPIGAGLAGRIAATGTPALSVDQPLDALDPLSDAGLRHAMAAPIEYNGERRAVLLVGGIRRDPALIDIDLGILAHFAVQVSATLQIAGLLGHEQRTLGRMTLLGQLSRFCQETRDEDQILHAFLTAVTANYGLRFNRAVLFLLNERKDLLVARMAIGHLALQQAVHDWVEHDAGSFQTYLETLRRGVLPFTPLLERVYGMAIPITRHEPDVLLTVLLESRTLNLEAADLVDLLPEEVLTVLQASGPTAIAPLAASGEVQGLVLVDNAFTQAPISDDDCEALLAFAHTTAVARENLRLVRDYETARLCLGGLLAATSGPLNPGADPHEVLRGAVARVREVTGAMWVSIILINDQEEVGLAISTRDGSFSAQSMIREHGVSKEVWRSGAPQVFERTELHRDRLQPVIFKRGVAAAACLPFVPGERRLGVVWLHWATARRYPTAEMQALQLYLHQIAVAYDNAQRIRALEQIRRASEAVTTARNWQAVLEQIARHGCDLLRGSAAIVWACDAPDGRFAPERSVSWNLAPGIWQAIRQCPPRGEGAVELALVEGWSAISNLGETASADASGIDRLIERAGSRACQMARIGAPGGVRGVLMVLYNRVQRFTWDDRKTAELFANYAALVLSQADLFESLRLANERLDAAQTTVRLVVNASALKDIGQALRSLVAGTRRLLGADTVVLYACDPEQRALTLPPVTEGVTNERHVAHKPRVLRDSLVAQVMRRQGVLIVEEVVADPRFSISNFVRREGIVACIARPLTYGGKCVGAMFANYRRPHRFSEEEIGHFALLADQAAIAIRNYQLYHEHQRRIFTLEAIQHAGQAVTGAVVRDALGRSPLGITLNRIVEQSLLLISPEVRNRSFSHLAMVEGTRLRFTAACPAERLEGLRQRIGDLELSGARCGVTGRAVRLKRPLRVDNVHTDPDYICYDPAVTSELAVPIMLGQRVIGVINLEHPSESAFDVEDERALQALADYAAIAIQNARLYACLETVEDIGRNVAMSTNVDTLLADLCRRLQQTMFPACLVRILLRDPDAERPCLILNPALSSGEMTGETRTQAFGEGICGHVAQQRAVALHNDLHDPRVQPVPVEPEAQGFPALAELCVPIIWGETTLGVLDVQSPCREAFGHDDVQALEIVAAQIAAALHHARYIESLHSMRGIVGGRTSLEWMRTVVNVWRHEIEDYAQNIRNEVRMVALTPPVVPYEQWVETRLSQIDVNAQRILDRSLTPALRADEGVAEVRLDDLIRRRVRELWLQERYTAAVPMPLLELQARAVVRANPELLRIAIEMLVRNAVEAMASVPAPSLRIATERLGSTARVLVRDSGPGIPPEIRGVLFKEQVRRPHRERLRGTGLLMVRAIIEAYGGRVEVLDSSAEGTTMLLELPAEAAAT